MNEKPKQKVIVYVDGFNFYYGLKDKNWKKYYWLNMVSFAEKLIKPHQEIIEVCYFSAKPTDADKAFRQNAFFQANKLDPRFKLHLAKYLKKSSICWSCRSTINTYEEKETDVRIATTMLADVYLKRCDVTILISADSDFVPPLEQIRKIDENHKIIVYFPPNRYSSNLQQLSNEAKKLENFELKFKDSLLPNSVTLENGFQLNIPLSWK